MPYIPDDKGQVFFLQNINICPTIILFTIPLHSQTFGTLSILCTHYSLLSCSLVEADSTHASLQSVAQAWTIESHKFFGDEE